MIVPNRIMPGIGLRHGACVAFLGTPSGDVTCASLSRPTAIRPGLRPVLSSQVLPHAATSLRRWTWRLTRRKPCCAVSIPATCWSPDAPPSELVDHLRGGAARGWTREAGHSPAGTGSKVHSRRLHRRSISATHLVDSESEQHPICPMQITDLTKH